MADILSPKERSVMMSKIRSKNTKPELIVRRAVHRLGYRYSLHRRDLPGCPDLTFPSRKKIIFVHGCYWHRHDGCKLATTPKTRKKFWNEKFRQNVQRDYQSLKTLRESGWKVLVIWQCEMKDAGRMSVRLKKFLR